jgi:hypothetical protein
MLRFAIMITFFICLLDLAFGQGDAPPFAKGQGASSKILSSVLQVPAKQVTKISASHALLETDNRNLLQNPGCEDQTAGNGWTASTTGTATLTTTTATADGIEGGNKYCNLTCNGGASGGTCSFKQSATTTTGLNTMVGAMFSAEPKGVSSGPTTHVYTLVSGTRTTSREITNAGSTTFWEPFYVNEVSGTSVGVEIEMTVAAANEIDARLDWAKVSPTELGATAIVTPWTACTVTGSWAANTTYSAKCRQSGQNLEVNASVTTSGAPTSTSLSINLPSGYTIDTGKMEFGANSAAKLGDGVARDAASASYEIAAYYLSISAVQLRSKDSSTAALGLNNAVTQASPFTWGASDALQILFSVPVVELSGSTNVFIANCGVACVDGFSARVSDADATSNEGGGDWINGNCTNATTGKATCNFNSGLFSVAPNCQVTTSAVPAAATEISCDLESEPTTSSVTVFCKQGSTAIDRQFHLSCSKAGADLVATRQIVGTFKNMVGNSMYSKPTFESCTITSSGGIPSADADCSTWITSVTDLATGSSRPNFVSGFWAAAPLCLSGHNSVQNMILSRAYSSSTSNVTVVTENSSTGADDDRSYTLFCFGPRN